MKLSEIINPPAMKNIITSYQRLPKEIRLKFDEANGISDLPIVSFPYKGMLAKGLIFNANDANYLVQMDEGHRGPVEEDTGEDVGEDHDEKDVPDLDDPVDEEE